MNKSKIYNLLGKVKDYDQNSNEVIRLIPTEGIMSKLQKQMYLSIQNERYLHAPPENHKKAIRYPDISNLQDIYEITRTAINQTFNAKFNIPDYLSGLHVIQLLIMSLTKAGDYILTVSSEHGGHEAVIKIIEDLYRKSAVMPFNLEHHILDFDQINPKLYPDIKLILIDHSNILHPHEVSKLRNLFPSAIIAYDISQVMALVAAKLFPNPLDYGADLISGSTHKSLCGPQKALMATNNSEIYEKINHHTKIYISNNHPASVAALAVCLLEFEIYGKEYSKLLLDNANTLADALYKYEIPIYNYKSIHTHFGKYTNSQHVWIDSEKINIDSETLVKKLYRSGIVTNTLYLPQGGINSCGAKGIRMGSIEVSRLGMGTSEMLLIAEAIANCIFDKLPENTIKTLMKDLRQNFQKPKFCLEELDEESIFSKWQ